MDSHGRQAYWKALMNAGCTAFRLAGVESYARSRRTGGVTILTYHSFTNGTSYPLLNRMPIKLFESQMRFLHRHYQVISLEVALRAIQQGGPIEGRDGKPKVVITVDDGFLDNYSLMFPVIRQFGFPATVFITTDFIDQGRPPWATQIFDCLARTRKAGMDEPFRCSLRTIPEKASAGRRLLQMWAGDDPEVRLLKVGALRLHLEVVPGDDVRPMTWRQLREIRSSNVEVGSHSVYHSILPLMPAGIQAMELRESKKRVEQETGGRCTSFSYPNGNWSEETTALLKEEGYCAALSQEWGWNLPGDDTYRLKRVDIPHNEGLSTFACRVSSLLRPGRIVIPSGRA